MALTVGIVGANGQVGSETALSLREGYDVQVLPICRTILGSAVLRNWGFECRCGRVGAEAETRRLLADCDVVVDMSLPRGNAAQMCAQITSNLEAIFRYAPEKAKVIYISSMMAFGMGDDHSKTFRSHLLSHSIYGGTKRHGERLARTFGKRFGRDVYSLRLGEVHGRLQSSTQLQVQKLRQLQPKLVNLVTGSRTPISKSESWGFNGLEPTNHNQGLLRDQKAPASADRNSVSTSSTTTPTTSTAATIPFNGISQYASDFQSLLNTAVQKAEVPVTQLQNQDEIVLSQETSLGSLNTAVSSLASSLTTLGTDAANADLSATSSDPTTVSVTDTGATSPATYTINSVTSVASAASETSTSFYANSSSTPVSSTGTMTLVVGTQQIPIDMSASGNNNLTYLENQINAAGAGVTASILTTPGGDYLSVSANSTGATTLQLFDGTPTTGTNILTGTNQGSDAQISVERDQCRSAWQYR